jgi:NAD(P)-dependent dehydrogenase (short-subunit alcohol dehydrogenase family)
MDETVLVIGSTGNIGLSAVLGALRSQRKVLAVVRNRASAVKLLRYVRWSEGVTFVEADIMSDSGIRSVVDQVKAGKLPAFQHVYAAAGGGAFGSTPLKDITTEELRYHMNTTFEANFCECTATVEFHARRQQTDPRRSPEKSPTETPSSTSSTKATPEAPGPSAPVLRAALPRELAPP